MCVLLARPSPYSGTRYILLQELEALKAKEKEEAEKEKEQKEGNRPSSDKGFIREVLAIQSVVGTRLSRTLFVFLNTFFLIKAKKAKLARLVG